MEQRYKTQSNKLYDRVWTNKSLLIGLAGGLGVLAGLSIMRVSNKTRRYADHAKERRSPFNMFAAGRYPHRREIDVSGRRPLFERRQSAYDQIDALIE
jgi:hypothetical protein